MQVYYKLCRGLLEDFEDFTVLEFPEMSGIGWERSPPWLS